MISTGTSSSSPVNEQGDMGNFMTDLDIALDYQTFRISDISYDGDSICIISVCTPPHPNHRADGYIQVTGDLRS